VSFLAARTRIRNLCVLCFLRGKNLLFFFGILFPLTLPLKETGGSPNRSTGLALYEYDVKLGASCNAEEVYFESLMLIRSSALLYQYLYICHSVCEELTVKCFPLTLGRGRLCKFEQLNGG
jgi:hypothetical protein